MSIDHSPRWGNVKSFVRIPRAPPPVRLDPVRIIVNAQSAQWGSNMNYRRDAWRTLIAVTALVAVACTDSPTPSEPTGGSPSYARSSTAQDRLAALFPGTSAEVLALPGTVYADHDEVRGKLVFGVENSRVVPGVQRSLAARGVRAEEYAIRIVPPIRQLSNLRTTAFRPTIAGVQIHFGQYVCTLGFNVTHVSSGERSFITNSHCTNTQGGVEGTTYAQPNRNTHPEVIATEVQDPVYTSFEGCSRGKACRYSDASRARYSSTVASTQGAIAQTTGVNNLSLETNSAFTITAQDNDTRNYAVGLEVNKVGRTTGWASGRVTSSCVTVNVSGTRIQQHCQTIVENPDAVIVQGGDSGSPIFTLSGTNATLRGILWGGGGDHLLVFSPLNNIQQELGSVDAVSGGGGGGGGSEPPPEECIPKGPNGNNCK